MANASDLDSRQPMLVQDRDTLLKIQELRRRAWSANGEVPDFIARQDILKDQHDVHGMHWAILKDGKLIAASRLCVHDNVSSSPDPEAYEGYEGKIAGPVGSLTRLVVDPDFRGNGFSKIMDAIRLAAAQDHKCNSVMGVCELESRMRALEHVGFVRLGPTKIRYLSYAPSIVLLKRLGDAAKSAVLTDHSPIVVTDSTTLLQVQELRRLAWNSLGEVPNFIAASNILTDEHDVHGLHWAVMHQGKPIAAARMCVHDSVSSMPDLEALDGYADHVQTPCAAFTRLVVHPDFRRLGLSKALDQIRTDQARIQGCKSLVSVTETEPRMKHLESLGFTHLGPTRIRYLSFAQSHVMLKRLDERRQSDFI